MKRLLVLMVLVYPFPLSATSVTISDCLGQDESQASNTCVATTATMNKNALGASSLNDPEKMAYDSTNNRVFISDAGNHRVLMFNAASTGLPTDHDCECALGQADFVSSAANRGGPAAANTLSAPQGVAYDSANNRLFVADAGNNRILVFDVSTCTSGENATFVLGQPNFATTAAACNASTMSGPTNLAVHTLASGRTDLIVSDSTNNRVLFYTNASPGTIANGMAATAVLGKGTVGDPGFNFACSVVIDGAGNAQNRLSGPLGLCRPSDADKLFIVDNGNNRVVVYDTTGITPGENAENVIGQDGYGAAHDGTNSETGAIHNAGLNTPIGCFVSGNYLYVSDNVNNRVVVFDRSTVTDGEAAVAVIGQAGFTTGTAATSATGMSAPVGVALFGNLLHVADSANNRVLFIPIVSTTTANVTSAKGTCKTTGSSPAATGTSFPNDSGNVTATHAWAQTAGISGTVTSATSATSTFTCAATASSGTATLTDTVSALGASTTSTMTLTVTNTAPTAAATAADSATDSDAILRAGESCSLSGTGSSDSDTDTLTSSWTQPTGVTLSSTTAASPTFTCPRRGTYRTTRTVNDGDGGQASTNLDFTITNSGVRVTRGASNAGNCMECESCSLNAGLTITDDDGDPLTYAWTLVSEPTTEAVDCSSIAALRLAPPLEPLAQTVSITNANAQTASFTPARSGDYVFSLAVTDDAGETTTTQITAAIQALDLVADDGDDGTDGTDDGTDGTADDTDGTVGGTPWAIHPRCREGTAAGYGCGLKQCR